MKPGELPEKMFFTDPFMLVDAYFEDDLLPKAFLLQMEDESEIAYMERVRLFLKQMDQASFTKLAHRINPRDPQQKRFFTFYIDV